MDDDDAEYMQGSDDEVRSIGYEVDDAELETDALWKDYGFDYSDGDDASDGGAPDLENLYYLAKCAHISLHIKNQG